MYQDQFSKLRDCDTPEGAGECIRKFTTILGYLEKSGGALPIQAIEEAVERTFTGKNNADWIKETGMETLRWTLPADRKYSWQSVIKDIGRLVTRHPELDEFRGNKKRSAARGRKRVPAQPWHPGTRGRGAGNQIRHKNTPRFL